MIYNESDHDFCRVAECTYKDEKYAARDNGEILRYPRDSKHPRPTDNKWTLGKLNDKTGYMEIASVRVHRIVATAFHGAPPTKEHVVDHIDTNKQNNRPENLRWVTRLENALNNPITRKRIILRCGSIEAFLANPSQLRENDIDQNFQWMRSVTPEEAKISKERLLAWAESDKTSTGKGSLGEWIFSQNKYDETTLEIPEQIMAKTPKAVQRDWRISSEFPCCPQEIMGEPIAVYAEKLKTGSVFCRNDVYTSLVFKSAVSNDRQSLYVMSESAESKNATKPWALAKITYENGLFTHSNLGSFFTREGAEKQFCLAQGLEWSGGDSIDDYC